VIWDARAIARPTYIGEGNILKRFADHASRQEKKFARPVDGYLAILGERSVGYHKSHGCVVEYLLLRVAAETDRVPSINRHPGKATLVRFLCDREPTLRVAITGFDPFANPSRARMLPSRKEIKVWLGREEELQVEHDWNRRRLRAPLPARRIF